ncbi:hypothetical protein BJX64DRAFT_207272 [Aspergillus heterothallicus]
MKIGKENVYPLWEMVLSLHRLWSATFQEVNVPVHTIRLTLLQDSSNVSKSLSCPGLSWLFYPCLGVGCRLKLPDDISSRPIYAMAKLTHLAQIQGAQFLRQLIALLLDKPTKTLQRLPTRPCPHFFHDLWNQAVHVLFAGFNDPEQETECRHISFRSCVSSRVSRRWRRNPAM